MRDLLTRAAERALSQIFESDYPILLREALRRLSAFREAEQESRVGRPPNAFVRRSGIRRQRGEAVGSRTTFAIAFSILLLPLLCVLLFNVPMPH